MFIFPSSRECLRAFCPADKLHGSETVCSDLNVKSWPSPPPPQKGVATQYLKCMFAFLIIDNILNPLSNGVCNPLCLIQVCKWVISVILDLVLAKWLCSHNLNICNCQMNACLNANTMLLLFGGRWKEISYLDKIFLKNNKPFII